MDHSEERILIIGAGAAGLTAAETLKQQGYRHITILEKSDRAGGKCYSPTYDGRVYELGAGILSASNKTALDLAKKHQVPVELVQFGSTMLVDGPTPSWQRTLKLWYQTIFRYLPLLFKYRSITQPGLTQVDPELCLPFTTFAQRHRIEVLAEELAPYYTGYGYDYFERVPAAYVLKYYSHGILWAFIRKKFYKFPLGIQSLWNSIAKQHDIRYNTIIQSIQRSDTITITTNNEKFECDRLIITIPLDETLQWLDTTSTEQTLFKKITYCDYRTYALWLKDFPNVTGYLPKHYHLDQIGQPVFWYQRYSDSKLYTFYTYGEGLGHIKQLVHRLGGSIERIETTQHWKYFPHVSSEEMQRGYFDQLEGLQGQQHTYYAGEVMNFSTVGLTAEYAEALVRRYF